MAKFVKNPSGTVHSAPDDFELPDEEWSEVTKSDATPQLLGKESDPAVDFTELREPAETVIDESGPAQEPGQPDARESNDIHPKGDNTPVGATSDNPEGGSEPTPAEEAAK